MVLSVVSFLPVLHYKHTPLHVFNTPGVIWCISKWYLCTILFFKAESPRSGLDPLRDYHARRCDNQAQFPRDSNPLFLPSFLSEKTKKKMQFCTGYSTNDELGSGDGPTTALLSVSYHKILVSFGIQ